MDLVVPQELANQKFMDADELADLMIVSQVRVSTGTEVRVEVEPAQGAKCERCWKILPSVGQDAEHPGLCSRCAKVVKGLKLEF